MSTATFKRQSVPLSKLFQSYGKNNSQSKYGAYFLATLIGSGIFATTYFNNNKNGNTPSNNHKKLLAGSGIVNTAAIPKGKSIKDYQSLYNEIAEKVRDQDDADDGAGRYGLLTRLAWHTSGTYKKEDNTGGSYGGTMIYEPESTDGENSGLNHGRDFLQEFKDKYSWLSHGDLWTLGGVVAIQECGGPKIKWRPGRQDITDKERVPENGRLPDASKDADYVKGVFGRMGFNERETVCLIGAHCLGKCHKENTNYDGPWGPSFNMFTNDFFVRLLQNWHVKKWDGKKQYEDDETNSFMMLPTDMALKEDSSFLKYVKMYADDEKLFFSDFAKNFSTLLELGVTFPDSIKPTEFKTLDEQDK